MFGKRVIGPKRRYTTEQLWKEIEAEEERLKKKFGVSDVSIKITLETSSEDADDDVCAEVSQERNRNL